jgi:hypothetical protein
LDLRFVAADRIAGIRRAFHRIEGAGVAVIAGIRAVPVTGLAQVDPIIAAGGFSFFDRSLSGVAGELAYKQAGREHG